MRKVGDLMRQLGFREEGSDAVKEAFIKNLYRSAYGMELNNRPKALTPPQPQKHPKPVSAKPPNEAQLSFPLEILGETLIDKSRRRSS